MKPYLVSISLRQGLLKRYNPKYGDDRICLCGHTYYRHFDGYDAYAGMSCKYCGCTEFVDASALYTEEVFDKLIEKFASFYFSDITFEDRLKNNKERTMTTELSEIIRYDDNTPLKEYVNELIKSLNIQPNGSKVKSKRQRMISRFQP